MSGALDYSEYSGYELDLPLPPPPSKDRPNVYHKRNEKYTTLRKQDSDLAYEVVTHSADSLDKRFLQKPATETTWTSVWRRGEFKRICWITFVVASLVIGLLGFSLAVAALSSQSNQSATTTTTAATCDCQSEVKELELALNQLRDQVKDLSTRQPNFISRANDSFSATLTDVELYSTCNTTVEASCTVPVGSEALGFSQCETTRVNVNVIEDHSADVKCVRTDTNAETNPVVVTLQRDGVQGTAHCQCYVVSPSSNMTQTMEVTCGLFVTRCAAQQNISSTILTNN